MNPTASGSGNGLDPFELRSRGRFCTVCGKQNPFSGPLVHVLDGNGGGELFDGAFCSKDCAGYGVRLVFSSVGSGSAGGSIRADWAVPRSYTAVKALGGGHFGHVYACVLQGPEDAPAAVYAIKRFRPEHNAHILFQREHRFLDLLRERRIYGAPTVWDVVHDWHGSSMIVMDYIPGTSLAEVIRTRRTHGTANEDPSEIEAEVIDFLFQVALILFQLHNYAGMLHRDIKPDNIIAIADGHGARGSRQREYFLVDFGIATSPVDGATAAQGTFEFAPEEQLRSRGRPVDASDIYSLGLTGVCLLLRCTGNELPLRSELVSTLDVSVPLPSNPMARRDLEARRAELSRFTNMRLRKILAKMVQPLHYDRHQTAFELIDELLDMDHDSAKLRSLSGPIWDQADPFIRLSMRALQRTIGGLRANSVFNRMHRLPRFPSDASVVAPAQLPAGQTGNVDALEMLSDTFELDIRLKLELAYSDAQALVHLIRFAIVDNAGTFQQAQMLPTSIRVGSVASGSTKVTIELKLPKKLPKSIKEDKVVEWVQQKLAELGPGGQPTLSEGLDQEEVRSLFDRIQKQLEELGPAVTNLVVKKRKSDGSFEQLSARKLKPKTEGTLSIDWGSQLWMPAAAAKRANAEFASWRSKPAAVPADMRPTYLHYTAPRADLMEDGAGEGDDKRRGDLCRRVEQLVSGRAETGELELVDLARVATSLEALATEGAGALGLSPTLRPGVALAVVKALANWQGSIVDSLTGPLADEAKRLASILNKLKADPSGTFAEVAGCARELLIVDSTSNRRWQRRVQWHSVSRTEYREVCLNLVENFKECICAVFELDISLLQDKKFKLPANGRTVVEKARVSVWIVGKASVDLLLVRIPSADDVEAIRSVKEAIMEEDAPEEETIAVDRPIDIAVVKFSNNQPLFTFSFLDTSFRSASDAKAWLWLGMVAGEARNRGFGSDVDARILRISSLMKKEEGMEKGRPVLLYSADKEERTEPVAPHKLYAEADSEDGDAAPAITLYVDGSLERAPAEAMAQPAMPSAFAVFPSQREVARVLLCRAAHILTGSPDPSQLGKHYRGFHFLVLTPRYNTLRNQTRNRLVLSGLLRPEDAEKQVLTYHESRSYVEAYEHFRKRALDEPKTLCVLVADECHWGIVGAKAHDRFVNDCGPSGQSEGRGRRLIESDNVLVLLVSATPTNVLTCKSRIPERYCLQKQLRASTEPGGAATESVAAGAVLQVVGRMDDSKFVKVKAEHDGKLLYVEPKALVGEKEIHVVRWDDEVSKIRPQNAEPGERRYHRVEEFVSSVTKERLCDKDLQDDPWFSDLLTKYHQELGRLLSKTERRKYKDMDILAADYAFSCFFRRFFFDIAPSVDFDTAYKRLLDAFARIFRKPAQGECGVDLAMVGTTYLKALSRVALPRAIAMEVPDLFGEEGSQESEELPDAMQLRQYVERKFELFRSGAGVALRYPGMQTWRYLYTQTDFIVQDLLNSSVDSTGIPRGRMKMVRSNDNATGARFEEILRAVRRECEWQERFELIPDFGNARLETALTHFFARRFVPQRTSMAAEEDPLTYEALEGLPCILILCEKGRMGDTFPRSFNTMDLRGRHVNSTGSMTSFVQEIGRMCRYADDSAEGRPYAIVGRKLDQAIRTALKQRTKTRERNPAAPESLLSYLRLEEYDSYVKTMKGFKRDYNRAVNSRQDFQPNAGSYDMDIFRRATSERVHTRRLLLEAEPQIGKTGAYILLLRSLREIISPAAFQPPPPLLPQSTGVAPSYSAPPEDWKGLEVLRERLALLRKSVTTGQYVDRVVEGEGPFELLPAAARLLLERLRSQQGSQSQAGKRQVEGSLPVKDLLDWDGRLGLDPTATLDSVKEVASLLQERLHCALRTAPQLPVMQPLRSAVEVDLAKARAQAQLPQAAPVRLERLRLQDALLGRIGVPAELFEQVFITRPLPGGPEVLFDGERVSGIKPPAASRSKTVAFVVCGHNPLDSHLEGPEGLPFARVAVVFSSCFEAFWSVWGSRITILCLPDALNIPTGVAQEPRSTRISAADGETGFARLFVQLLAFHTTPRLGLVWLLDDTVVACEEKPLGDAALAVEGRIQEAQQRHEPVAVAGLGCRTRAKPGTRAEPAVRPTETAYVYGLFLLDVQLTMGLNCFYPPKRHWSEVDFHFVCIERGLKVWRMEDLHIVIAFSLQVTAMPKPAPAMRPWPARAGGGYALDLSAASPNEPQLGVLLPWLAAQLGDGMLLGLPPDYKQDADPYKEFNWPVQDAIKNAGLTLQWRRWDKLEDISQASKGKAFSAAMYFPNPNFHFETTHVPVWLWREVQSAKLLVIAPLSAWSAESREGGILEVAAQNRNREWQLERAWSSAPPDAEGRVPAPPAPAPPEQSVWVAFELVRIKLEPQLQAPQPAPQAPPTPQLPPPPRPMLLADVVKTEDSPLLPSPPAGVPPAAGPSQPGKKSAAGEIPAAASGPNPAKKKTLRELDADIVTRSADELTEAGFRSYLRNEFKKSKGASLSGEELEAKGAVAWVELAKEERFEFCKKELQRNFRPKMALSFYKLDIARPDSVNIDPKQKKLPEHLKPEEKKSYSDLEKKDKTRFSKELARLQECFEVSAPAKEARAPKKAAEGGEAAAKGKKRKSLEAAAGQPGPKKGAAAAAAAKGKVVVKAEESEEEEEEEEEEEDD